MIKKWKMFVESNPASRTDSDPYLQDLKDIFSKISDETTFFVNIGLDHKMSDEESKYFIVNIFTNNRTSIGMGNPYSNEDINEDLIKELDLMLKEVQKEVEIQSYLIDAIKRLDSSGYRVISYHTIFNSNIPRIQINLKIND
jgi:hypothetical protein